MACAEDSVERGIPFRVRVERRGTDSTLTGALSPGGRLIWLRLDSDLSGGSSLLPRPMLVEQPCAQVRFDRGEVSGELTFRCVSPVY